MTGRDQRWQHSSRCPNIFYALLLVLLAGIVFNIGRKSNLIVFILAMLLPVTTVFIFMLLGGKIDMC
ncbi:hypothetical protein DQA24_28380 [Escherichia coli]|nr:hypothetical protein [Escherichia coli]EFO3183300.1 hypothetical protein [Escherichia coli]